MKKLIQTYTAISVFVLIIVFPPLSPAYALEAEIVKGLKDNFSNPPMDCWPGTYWCWPGNAVTREEITWELEQMHEKGIGGVLLNSCVPEVYEKGNIAYLSDEYLEMVKHTVRTAKRLGMKLNVAFGEHWVLGGYWVPPQDRSQSLVPTAIELQGPQVFSSELPKFKKAADHRSEIRADGIPDVDKLVAIVAGKVVNDKIDPSTLTELTSKVKDSTLTWQVPEGNWRLMTFWLKFTGQGGPSDQWPVPHWCIDHFSETAMQRYCDFLGGKFYQSFGEEFGKTVQLFHCDSVELANLPNGIYWSDGLMAEFRELQGYDLAKYLPAIWWQVDEISPKIRYDVSEVLHHVGLEVFYKTFLNWCREHGLKGSTEPIGFPTDVLESAGLAHLPMMEVTPGEKTGAAPWFDTRIGPKKYIASGAHLYDRNTVAVEAYTYIHWQLYRATLEELKIASDGFLRSGANKFYNHFYSYSPERDVAPSRSLPFAARISHTNIWWKYYPLLAKYVARCSYLLRQGNFTPDVALYSPLANQWTLSVLNARKWTRDFDWGDLGKLLIGSGYDFDLLNDDILQNHAKIEDGKIKVRNMEYKILVLPNIKALPLKTMEFIRQYASQGGIVIALERLPDSSVGFADYADKDKKVIDIVNEMFKESGGLGDIASKDYGKGRTYHIKEIIRRHEIYDPPSPSVAFNPFVNTLRSHLPPDFEFDFAMEGLRENDGLTFMHRRLKDTDIYFVTNIRNSISRFPVTFRIKDKIPWKWNPYNGKVTQVFHYRSNGDRTEVPLNLAPYESTFVVFMPGREKIYVERSNFYDITQLTNNAITALAAENGNYQITLNRNNHTIDRSVRVTNVPAPYVIAGQWKLTLKGRDFPKMDTTLTGLSSWTDNPRTEHFSGTGRYEIEFVLPEKYIADNINLHLDLGKVGNVAEVELNGVNVGTVWMCGQKSDITNAVRAGINRMVVLVTNTLINRVSAFKEPPPVPEELVPYYGSGTTPYSAWFRGPIGFKPLPASGLMGPVKIITLKKVKISTK